MNKLVSTSDGRKDLGKYWGEMMKGQPMPEAIKDLINLGPFEAVEGNKYGPTGEQLFVADFDTSPRATVYLDDVNPNEIKSTDKDCNLHQDGSKSKDKKPYVDEFEPRPNVSMYND